MKDGDIVYMVGGTVEERFWIIGHVVEFEDSTFVIARNEKGVHLYDKMDVWGLTKKEAKLKMHRGMVNTLHAKLKSLEQLDDDCSSKSEQRSGQ